MRGGKRNERRWNKKRDNKEEEIKGRTRGRDSDCMKWQA